MNRVMSQIATIGVVITLMGCGGGNPPTIVATNSGNTVSDVKSVMSQLDIPGVSIAVINNFEVAEVLAIGVIDQNSQQQVTEQTMFQAASISKAITSVATMKWAADYQININSDINDLLVHWNLPENSLTTQHKVTVEGILRHTAGINVSGFPGYNQAVALPTLTEILSGHAIANTDTIEVINEPSTKWLYSGGGYTILQQAIEDQTGMTFADFMHWQITEFLGLDNSTFEQDNNLDRLDRSSGHIHGKSPVAGGYHIYPEQAAAGFWTNANDLAQFAIQFQLALKGDSQMLSSALATEMLTSTISEKYGIGFELFENGDFGHSGANEGFRSLMRLNSNGFGLIILTNSDNGERMMAPLIKLFSNKYEQ